MPGANSHGDNAGGGYTRLFGVGFALIFIIGALTAAGFFVDKLFGTLPLFLIIGLGIGFAGGLYYVYVALKRLGDG